MVWYDPILEKIKDAVDNVIPGQVVPRSNQRLYRDRTYGSYLRKKSDITEYLSRRRNIQALEHEMERERGGDAAKVYDSACSKWQNNYDDLVRRIQYHEILRGMYPFYSSDRRRIEKTIISLEKQRYEMSESTAIWESATIEDRETQEKKRKFWFGLIGLAVGGGIASTQIPKIREHFDKVKRVVDDVKEILKNLGQQPQSA